MKEIDMTKYDVYITEEEPNLMLSKQAWEHLLELHNNIEKMPTPMLKQVKKLIIED